MPEVRHALLEDANDGKRNAENLEGPSDRRIVAAVAIPSENRGHYCALVVRRVVGFVEKPAFGHNQIANVLVLRAYAQHRRILLGSAGKAEAVVHLHHRRGIHHAGHLLVHGLFVLARKVVGITRALRGRGASARILQLH